MHILELYIESGGFDYRLIKGGISVYLWNLVQAFDAAGHQTSVLSALNGQHDFLTAEHGLEQLDYRHDWVAHIDADPRIWGDRIDRHLPLQTTAYRLRKAGTDFYYLRNDFLDRYPDTYYPPYEGKGSDPGFYKPLIFQMEAVFFVRSWFAEDNLLIHAHEPYYQYLVPAAFAQDKRKRVVSTVQSNMPIAKKVYLPETRSAFAQLGVSPELVTPEAPLTDTIFNRCMMAYLPRTHLSYPYPEDNVSLFDLVLDHSDLVDFLAEGHLEFYRHFTGTAFRALFVQLPVFEKYRGNAYKLFVGGCGLADSWLSDPFEIDRTGQLEALGLDPALPTFFHSARYAPNHKGQVELVLAIRRSLEAGCRANFIVRCISGSGIADPRFHALARDFPGNVYLTWENQDEATLKAMAAAADFALFPSKFEMDTFLIAQGEAMAAGAVPVAADQFGMAHWRHGRGEPDGDRRTGFAVIRSFLEEDMGLVASICDAIDRATALFADRPRYTEMSARARACAQECGWSAVADRHLRAFARIDAPAAALDRDNPAPGSFATWRDAARVVGQVIDHRQAGADDVAPLAFVDGQLRYQRGDAAQALAFAWHDARFHEQLMDIAPTGDLFTAKGLPSDLIIILVTLHNGDQFWDGLVSTQDRA